MVMFIQSHQFNYVIICYFCPVTKYVWLVVKLYIIFKGTSADPTLIFILCRLEGPIYILYIAMQPCSWCMYMYMYTFRESSYLTDDCMVYIVCMKLRVTSMQ